MTAHNSQRSRLWLSYLIYAVTMLIGIFALLYPFLLPEITQQVPLGQARANETPFVLTLLLVLCIVILVYEVQGVAINTKLIALLGILVAINSTLRFIEVAIPAPAGFSPIFFLIIMTGYVFGGRFGSLMGAMTILVSAVITGGIGPWMPSQMFAAGWVGLSASLLLAINRRLTLIDTRGEIFTLALLGLLWGLAYGAILNLWTWPFISGPQEQYWAEGIGLVESLKRYAAYYLVTSLFWDVIRAAGNFVLILFLGGPTLRALKRFHRRFTFNYQTVSTGKTTSQVGEQIH